MQYKPWLEISFAIVFLVCYIIYVLRDKDPECICEVCEWRGKEEKLDTFSTDKEDHWFSFCPECKSSKIIHLKNKTA